MKQLKISFKDGKPKEVYEEVEDFEIDVPKEYKILELKQNLKDTDYLSHKHHEGELTDEEFEPIKLQRRAWREEINKLESEDKSDGVG